MIHKIVNILQIITAIEVSIALVILCISLITNNIDLAIIIILVTAMMCILLAIILLIDTIIDVKRSG